MLNALFVLAVAASLLLAGATGRMEALTHAILDDAGKAVTLAIGLVGVMALFLGLMRIVERAGLLRHVARAARPVTRLLFPEVPAEHPAMQAILLNLSSNLLGLANAATPFGIKAMEELDRLNGRKGTATNAMVLFLAINTAGLSIVPTSVIAVRAALGSSDPAGILVPTWIASAFGTAVAIGAALALARLPRFRASEPPAVSDPAVDVTARSVDPDRALPDASPSAARFAAAGLFFAGLIFLAVRQALSTDGSALREIASFWLLPAFVGALVLTGWACGVRVYDAVVDGAREGFEVALRIIPYLVAVLVAAGMVRASGGIEILVRLVGPWTEAVLLPAEALPMALLRPLTGSGALAVMSEVMTAHGPDSYLGYLVSTMQGSTETTFYVLAVYFGAVRVRHARHALPACLLADAAGLLAAAVVVRWWFG